jgi:hypothetical protein
MLARPDISAGPLPSPPRCFTTAGGTSGDPSELSGGDDKVIALEIDILDAQLETLLQPQAGAT